MNENHKNLGSSLDDLLEEDDILPQVTDAATKRVMAWLSDTNNKKEFNHDCPNFEINAEEFGKK